MPPVKTVASPSDVDNEATAELPVLDVAAYEATLNEPASTTDSWIAPAPAVDLTATQSLPAVEIAAIPTLQAAEPERFEDLSGTHEMPPFARPNKIVKATPASLSRPAARVPQSLPPPPVAAPSPQTEFILPPAPPAPARPMAVPPSPPLIEELRGALAAAERRVEELNERARIADAERSVAMARAMAENQQLREQLGVHLEAIHTSSGRLGAQRADESALEDELFARADTIDSLRKEVANQAQALARVCATLQDDQTQRARLDTDCMNLRATLERRDARIGVLEADLAARHQRELTLTSRLEEAMSQADPLAPGLRGQIAARDEQIGDLQRRLAAAQVQLTEKDADLQVAEESIHHLEAEVRDKSGKLQEASVTVEEWRAVIAESQRSILQRDNRIQELEASVERQRAAAADSAAQTGEEIALEGPARLLIRTDGNTDFVHVLGRRTRIGRGPDNELVLDTKHVSRYHAVLLAGPVHTSIEDLNSTNGVFVNNKRVTRQVLKDGDRVTIGRSQFRYTTRG